MAAQVRREVPSEEQFEVAIGTLKLLGDPTRLRILWALLEGEDSVNQLADRIGAQPTTVSQHLAKLRLGRLVQTRREGTRIFYCAESAHVRRLVEEALFHADHVAQDLPHHDGKGHRRTPRRGKTA